MIESFKSWFNNHEKLGVLLMLVLFMGFFVSLKYLPDNCDTQPGQLSCRVKAAQASGCAIPNPQRNSLGEITDDDRVYAALDECGY